MVKNSLLSNLILFSFFNACLLTVPMVGRTLDIAAFNIVRYSPSPVKEAGVKFINSTISCPKTGIALNKFVITVAKIYNIFVYSYPFSLHQPVSLFARLILLIFIIPLLFPRRGTTREVAFVFVKHHLEAKRPK